MERRHDFLWNSFGYLDDEEDALFTVRYLCLGSFIAMVLGTILQWLFFSFYNEKYHPFKDILVDKPDIEVVEKNSFCIDIINWKNMCFNFIHGMTGRDDHPRTSNEGNF